MRFSIIIPTYERPTELAGLLESLAVCDGDLIQEVIICDDGSTYDVKGTLRPFSRHFAVRYLAQQHDGFRAAAARNMGLQVSIGDAVLYLDDDLVVPKHFLLAHSEAHAASTGPAVVLGLRHRSNGGECPATVAEICDHRVIFAGDNTAFASSRTPWYFAYTCNLSVAGKFRSVLFDERFIGWGNEDVDYAYRVWRAGAVFQFSRDAWASQTSDQGKLCRDPFRARDTQRPADFGPFVRNARYLASKYPDDADLQAVMAAAISQADGSALVHSDKSNACQ